MLPGVTETAVDLDEDSIYDRLDITIPLYADDLVAGYYEWSVSLMDAEGLVLGTAAGNVNFVSGNGGASISMSFDGAGIAKTSLDGPYYVRNLILWGDGKTFTIDGEHKTLAYSVSQWGGSLGKCIVTFDPNGGSVSPATQTIERGGEIGDLPIPKRTGYTFDGWYTEASGGIQIQPTTVVTENITFYAHWIKNIRKLFSNSSNWNYSPLQSYSFSSYLQAPNNGEVVGTMTVNLRKGKFGDVLATVTIKPLGGKKQVIKGRISASDGFGMESLAGLRFTSEGVTGTIGGYNVDGVIDMAKAKSPVTAGVLKAFKGKRFVTILKPDKVTGANAFADKGVANLSIVFAVNGKAKVKGTMSDGTKVSFPGQLLVGSEWCCLPVVYSKKSNFGFLLWFDRDGNFDSVDGVTTWKGKGFEVTWKDDVEVSEK